MHRSFAVRLFPLGACLLLTSCGERPRTADDIQALYRTYRDAVAGGNGRAAAECVSTSTFDEYQTYIDLALGADESTLKRQSAGTRLQVLLLRQRLDGAELTVVDGRRLFEWMIDEQWLAADTVSAVQIGDIQLRGERADAPTFADGRRTGDRAHFVRRDGQWKLDLLPGLRGADRHLAESAERARKSENEFILSLIETTTGQRPGEDIWEPLSSTR